MKLELGGTDILVNNAAHQKTFEKIEDMSDEEWERTFESTFTPADPPNLTACICDDERCDPKLYRGPGTSTRRKRHLREFGRTRSDLDAPHTVNNAKGCGGKLRQAGSDETTWLTAELAMPSDAGGSAIQLCIESNNSGHRRKTDL